MTQLVGLNERFPLQHAGLVDQPATVQPSLLAFVAVAIQNAFHKNKFPVEVFVNYSGKKNVNAIFSISQGNIILNKQNNKQMYN